MRHWFMMAALAGSDEQAKIAACGQWAIAYITLNKFGRDELERGGNYLEERGSIPSNDWAAIFEEICKREDLSPGAFKAFLT